MATSEMSRPVKTADGRRSRKQDAPCPDSEMEPTHDTICRRIPRVITRFARRERPDHA